MTALSRSTGNYSKDAARVAARRARNGAAIVAAPATPPATPPADLTIASAIDGGNGASGGPSGEQRTNGRFQPGNSAALKHGRRATAFQQALVRQAQAALVERRQSITSDLGGESSLSTIATDTVQRYLVSCALLEWIENELLSQGVVTGKGKRRALHGAYLAQLDRVTALAKLIGLDRKQRPTTFKDALSTVSPPVGGEVVPPGREGGAGAPALEST